MGADALQWVPGSSGEWLQWWWMEASLGGSLAGVTKGIYREFVSQSDQSAQGAILT